MLLELQIKALLESLARSLLDDVGRGPRVSVRAG